MSSDNKIWILADAFVSGSLTDIELATLQNRLDTEPVFAEEFRESVNLVRALKGSADQKRMHNMLHEIHEEQVNSKVTIKKLRTIPIKAHYWRSAAVAAGVALLTSLGTYFIFTTTDKKNTSQYSLLHREVEKTNHEVENLKQSQKQLIKNINSKNYTPPSEVRYTGTGFALTNDGYFVTNYHVTDGADSIYIQNQEGDYFKAYPVAADEATDIAILKVENKKFRFSKTDVPYTFANGKSGIGAEVFTLGYPDDDIVYNKGYISGRNGYKGDVKQYLLEMPADHGQSGAPVLDEDGNVIGIVTAKSESEPNTYAVSSKALIQFIHSLPDVNLHLPKTNKLGNLSREEQIKKLEAYTCSVKVYKK